MNVNYAAFQPWIKQDFNTALQALLQDGRYHSLANHALMLGRCQDWYSAPEHARKVTLCCFFLFVMLIRTHPSHSPLDCQTLATSH